MAIGVKYESAAAAWARSGMRRFDEAPRAHASTDDLQVMADLLEVDMSVLGPRPIVPMEVRRNGEISSAASPVEAGVTGSRQVSSSNADDRREPLFHDENFATHQTFADIVRIPAKRPAPMVRSVDKGELL